VDLPAKPQQLLGNTLMAMFGCPHQGGHALLLGKSLVPEENSWVNDDSQLITLWYKLP
jgi:hypothetical protein